MPEKIHGIIEETYFSSPTFSAGVLDAGESTHIKFSGKFQAVVGESVSLVGSWEKHPKYGYQFKATGLSYELPDSPEGLIRYLSGHKAFKGIGDITAKKIVDYAQTVDRLDSLIRDGLQEMRSRLRIPMSTLETLRACWISNAAENAVRSYLAAFELTPHQMDTLLQKFGEGIVGILKTDPYVLIRHVDKYGFKRVDAIALKTGIPKEHPGRIKAGLIHTVTEVIDEGHTWIDAGELIRKANDLLLLDDLDSMERIQRAGKELVESGDLVADDAAITLPHVYEAEQTVAHTFQMARTLPRVDMAPCSVPEQLNEDQGRAYAMAMRERICVISGKAGTGKSHLLGKLTSAWQEHGLSVCLCAPTGKAAKRIEEVLREKHGIHGVEAKTIHRLLGYDGYQFHVDRIDADVIALDEFSMVDVELCAELFKRVDISRTRIILVGDHNQLPPVGAGNILRDIMDHDLVPNIILDTVVRNAGPIERAAQAILGGVVPPTAPGEPEWAVVDSFKDPDAIRSYVRDLVIDLIPNHLHYDPVKDVQIITPMHKGPLGTQSMNAMMQYLFHGDVKGRFAVGDKVMQTSNDYTLGIMNGTQGIVTAIQPEGLTVHFDGEGERFVDSERVSNIQLSFVVTAHKGQGSEFPCVIVVCHKSHFFADRNWVYTSVTRASGHVIVVGDRWGIRNAVRKNEVRTRRTFLSLWAQSPAIVE